MRQMLTQAQTAGQYFTNDQIKEMTRKASAEGDLGHQQTQNQRYGSDRKSGSAGMPRPSSYAGFCGKKKKRGVPLAHSGRRLRAGRRDRRALCGERWSAS